MPLPRLAIWDVDGTLVDSRAVIQDCMEVAFRQSGLPPPDYDATRRVIGISLVEALTILAPPDIGAARLGILVDHLVDGSKESRLATHVMRSSQFVLVTGHPFVDVWEGVRPKVLGIDAWPRVPRDRPWKEGVCAALGADPVRFWPQLRTRVTSFADLEPELVGSVERLIDFLT